jgi:hypothetical protein
MAVLLYIFQTQRASVLLHRPTITTTTTTLIITAPNSSIIVNQATIFQEIRTKLDER